MATITVIRRIGAPAQLVFQAVADPRRFAQAIAGVTELRFLSQATAGLGTRFRQTRERNGKAMTMDFEITEYEPVSRVRIHNVTHDTEWDSVFSLRPTKTGTQLTVQMTTHSEKPLARVLMPLICLLIRKPVARDIDAVKTWCEAVGV